MSWLEKLSFEFEMGGITDMDAGAFMCPLSVRLEEYGKISQKVFRMGGAEFVAQVVELRSKLSDEKLPLGESVPLELKPTYNMGKSKYVILTALWDSESEYNYNLFYKAYMTAIRAAMNLSLESIVVPAMGYDGSLPISGKAFLKVIQELDALKHSDGFSLQDIFVVSTNQRHLDYLRTHIEGKIYR